MTKRQKPGSKELAVAEGEPDQELSREGSGAAQAVGAVPMEFLYRDRPVRTVQRAEETWFVASDVCDVLEVVNMTNAVRRLHQDDKGVHTVKTLGGDQQFVVVNESGLWDLTFTSRKPQARELCRWVTGTVLPSIRRTGRYDGGASAEAAGVHASLSGRFGPDRTAQVRLPGPGRYVATVLPDGRYHVHARPYEDGIADADRVAVRVLSHVLKLIEGLFDQEQLLRSTGSAGLPSPRFEMMVREGGRLADGHLPVPDPG